MGNKYMRDVRNKYLRQPRVYVISYRTPNADPGIPLQRTALSLSTLRADSSDLKRFLRSMLNVCSTQTHNYVSRYTSTVGYSTTGLDAFTLSLTPMLFFYYVGIRCCSWINMRNADTGGLLFIVLDRMRVITMHETRRSCWRGRHSFPSRSKCCLTPGTLWMDRKQGTSWNMTSAR